MNEALDRKAHQAALAAWLTELNEQHGAPGDDDYAQAAAFLDALEHGRLTGR